MFVLGEGNENLKLWKGIPQVITSRIPQNSNSVTWGDAFSFLFRNLHILTN